MRRVLEHGHTGGGWSHLLEQLELFPCEIRGCAYRPCDVPPWLRQAPHQPLLDRIEGARKDDGDGGGLLTSCPRRECPEGHEDVHLETHQLSGEGGEQRLFSPERAVLNANVLALDIAQITQPLPEGRDTALGVRESRREVCIGEDANDGDVLPRLGVGCEECREDAEGEGDEDSDGARPHGNPLKSVLCLHSLFHCSEAERWASGAPESGSGADAGGRRLHALVRLVLAQTTGLPHLHIPNASLDTG
jgi:hypothetical protein